MYHKLSSRFEQRLTAAYISFEIPQNLYCNFHGFHLSIFSYYISFVPLIAPINRDEINHVQYVETKELSVEFAWPHIGVITKYELM